MSRIKAALQQYFGYSEFRHQQEAIVAHLVSGQDALVLMPTGGGKSICYQLPALVRGGVTLVVSPLIALMKDQVDALKQNGIPAAYLNSALSSAQQNDVIVRLKNSELKLLYLAPEKLVGDPRFLDQLKEVKVSMIAIDEAHCISQWGHDFRPEYLSLGQLKTVFPGIPFVALTATADRLTRNDIVDKLLLHQCRVFEHSFNRPNIFYKVQPKKHLAGQIIEYLNGHKNDSGIIYCLSRNGTEELAEQLKAAGFQAEAYHAGLDRQEREQRQDRFLRDELRIMVATIAFGMGIDKSNVRFVLHADMPKNMEGYYQETGRAGRDGLPSEAVLFFSYGDASKLKYFTAIDGNEEQSRILANKLDRMVQLCTVTTCRRKYLLNYFGENAPDKCGYCDVCRTQYQRADATIPAQKILSAVARLDGRFGLHYVVDLLRGSSTTRMEHQSLKTYGAGRELSKAQWLQYGKELLQMGYLKQTDDRYPVVQLTDSSMAVLKGETTVMLVAATTAREETKPAAGQVMAEAYPELLQELKVLRKQLADAQDLPAFTIFSDATLVELATYIPLDKEELMQVSGFGEVKMQRYGTAFLEVVKAYAAGHQLTSRIHLKTAKKAKLVKDEDPGRINDTRQETFQLYKAGKTVDEICSIRNLKKSTIEEHLATYVFNGMLDIASFVTPQKQVLIRKVIDKHGAMALSPIKQELGADFSYGEIRMVIADRQRGAAL